MPPGRGVFCNDDAEYARMGRSSDDVTVDTPVTMTIASPVPPTLLRMWGQANLGPFPDKFTEPDCEVNWEPQADPTMDEGSMKLGAILVHYEFVSQLFYNRLDMISKYDLPELQEAYIYI